jgi:uncharacterized protein YegP (UPF0339 family)
VLALRHPLGVRGRFPHGAPRDGRRTSGHQAEGRLRDLAPVHHHHEGADAVTFEIFKDNGGHFHWRLVSDGGMAVAVCAAGYGSVRDARRAAADVHLGAGSATGAETESP